MSGLTVVRVLRPSGSLTLHQQATATHDPEWDILSVRCTDRSFDAQYGELAVYGPEDWLEARIIPQVGNETIFLSTLGRQRNETVVHP